MPNPTENGGGGGGPAEINLVDDDATDHATIPSDYTQQQHQQDEIYDPFAPVGGRPSAWATPRTSNAAATRAGGEVIELIDSDEESSSQQQQQQQSPQPARLSSASSTNSTSGGRGWSAITLELSQTDSFTEATKLYTLGKVTASTCERGSSMLFTVSQVPPKLTVDDHQIIPWFEELLNLPCLRLKPCWEDEKTAKGSLERFCRRRLKEHRVAVLSIDWLERTHPSWMGSHGLTGHLYLTPGDCEARGKDGEEGGEEDSVADSGSEMTLYYASHGRPHA